MKLYLVGMTIFFSTQFAMAHNVERNTTFGCETTTSEKPNETRYNPVGVVFDYDPKNPQEGSMGTGTLIDDDLILTAGHIIQKSMRKGGANLYFSPGYPQGFAGGKDIPTEFIKVEAVRIGSADWAILKLKEPIGREYGHLSIKKRKDKKVGIGGVKIEALGYPTLCFDETKILVPFSRARCQTVVEHERGIQYNCPGGSGRSGGPILYDKIDSKEIIGIHVSSFGHGSRASYFLPSHVIYHEMKDFKRFPWRSTKL